MDKKALKDYILVNFGLVTNERILKGIKAIIDNLKNIEELRIVLKKPMLDGTCELAWNLED